MTHTTPHTTLHTAPQTARRAPPLGARRAPDQTAAGPAEVATGAGNQAVLAGAGDFADTLGPGRPLDAQTRQRMESAFGQGFEHVLVHTGAEAGQAARRHAAQALTVGDHIAFAPGNYRPGTPVGDAMLAHELAHTIQQREAPETDAGMPLVEPVGSALEADADQAAVGVMRSLWGARRGVAATGLTDAQPALRSALRVQRCSCGGPPAFDGTFESRLFAPDIDPGLHVADAGDGINAFLLPKMYSVDGAVRPVGGTTEQLSYWEMGFTQTAYDDRTEAFYALPDGTPHRRSLLTYPPAWDGGPDVHAPWYIDPRELEQPGQTVSQTMTDWPNAAIPWASDDGRGQLVESSGQTKLCTWLIVKQKNTREPLYLNWDTWQVDWGATYDPVARTGTEAPGAGGSIVGPAHGDTGRGNVTPVLDGRTANSYANDPTNRHWRRWQ